MIVIDTTKNTIQVGSAIKKCNSPQIMNMLVYLVQANGVPKTNKDIIQNCWLTKLVGSRNVDVALTKIRKILNDPDPGKVIERIRTAPSSIRINPGKIKIIGQTGNTSKAYEGYEFMKQAKMKGVKDIYVVLQRIKDKDDWIIVPKSEYDHDI